MIAAIGIVVVAASSAIIQNEQELEEEREKILKNLKINMERKTLKEEPLHMKKHLKVLAGMLCGAKRYGKIKRRIENISFKRKT